MASIKIGVGFKLLFFFRWGPELREGLGSVSEEVKWGDLDGGERRRQTFRPNVLLLMAASLLPLTSPRHLDWGCRST